MRAGVTDTYLGIDDLKFPRAIGRLVLRCADEGDEGCAEEHLDDTCCALVIYTALSASPVAAAKKRDVLFAWTFPKGSQLRMVYPFLCPTAMHE